jgi:hypothetical protein
MPCNLVAGIGVIRKTIAMRFTVLLIAFLTTSTISHAQTKKIAFKSHSGNMEEFHWALSGDNELEYSNFGMAPEPLVKEARLDSIIFICDSVAVIVTSEYCRRNRSKRLSRWRAGSDTVTNHPVFSASLSDDSIRKILRTQYYFRGEIDSVQIVDKREEMMYPCTPLITKVDTQNPGSESALPAGILIGVIVLGTLFTQMPRYRDL